MRKCEVWTQDTTTRNTVMEIERINAIGNTLSDLSQRTLDLRGYL